MMAASSALPRKVRRASKYATGVPPMMPSSVAVVAAKRGEQERLPQLGVGAQGPDAANAARRDETGHRAEDEQQKQRRDDGDDDRRDSPRPDRAARGNRDRTLIGRRQDPNHGLKKAPPRGARHGEKLSPSFSVVVSRGHCASRNAPGRIDSLPVPTRPNRRPALSEQSAHV